MTAALLSLGLPLGLVGAAGADLRGFELPAGLTPGLAALYLAVALLEQTAAVTLAWHAGVALTVLAAGTLLFMYGLFGGGDVKLLAAAALWAGPGLLPELLMVMALAGGALALVLLALRRWRPRASGPAAPGAPLPYAVAIACGTLAVYPAMGHLA